MRICDHQNKKTNKHHKSKLKNKKAIKNVKKTNKKQKKNKKPNQKISSASASVYCKPMQIMTESIVCNTNIPGDCNAAIGIAHQPLPSSLQTNTLSSNLYILFNKITLYSSPNVVRCAGGDFVDAPTIHLQHHRSFFYFNQFNSIPSHILNL